MWTRTKLVQSFENLGPDQDNGVQQPRNATEEYPSVVDFRIRLHSVVVETVTTEANRKIFKKYFKINSVALGCFHHPNRRISNQNTLRMSSFPFTTESNRK